MRTWIEPHAFPVPAALQAAVGGHPLVAQTLARRGIMTPEAARPFLDPACYSPASPSALPGLGAAADRLSDAIRRGEPICVWGDFDVDGQTATTVLVTTLRQLGAPVSFHIPGRERESHGVNLPMLQSIIAAGARLILTCDTGITAHEAVAFARRQGVDFIITDHHELPPSLPEALAVVNPKLISSHANLTEAGSSLSTLPGVGVAYKLAEELYARFGRAGEADQLADLAALGIVADVAYQVGETRYLVQRGLALLRQAKRPGLKAMLETAELNPAWLTETHLAFALAPRLNALGRLSDANTAVELLTTTDLSRARVLAVMLEGLNARRQLLTSQVFQAAQAQIRDNPALLDEPALVLSHPSWPAGVIGIVASRLVELYNRPTVLIATPPGELARGSARSIEGVNITAAIAAQEALLAGFGGHPMAAGLSLDPAHLADFRRGLLNTLRQMSPAARPANDLQIDGYVTLPELNLELVEDLGRLAPFGPGNPPLVLAARNLRLKSHTAIGRGDEHLQLIVEDEQGHSCKVLWWQGAGQEVPQGRFDLAFTVHASDYRGQREVAVEWIDARLLEAPTIVTETAPKIAITDYRRQLQPLALLTQLLAEEPLQVWGEANAHPKLAAIGITPRHRLELETAPKLVIWTIPPGPAELRSALAAVSPQVVYLFAVAPDTDCMEGFLKRLAGLVKFALQNYDGQASVLRLAAATAQRPVTVRKGLEWLAAQGHITISKRDGDELWLAQGGQSHPQAVERLTAQLRAMLEESRAYREYFIEAEAETLLQVVGRGIP